MICPMAFSNPGMYKTVRGYEGMVHCIPDCAWAVKRIDSIEGKVIEEYGCAIAFMTNKIVNTRPLKDDAE